MIFDNLIKSFQNQAEAWQSVHDMLTSGTIEFHNADDEIALLHIASFNRFCCEKSAEHFQKNNKGD